MDVRRFFEDRFRKYGDSPETLDWSEQGQRRRFEILAEVADMTNKKVLDLGSGLGDFYGFLAGKFHNVSYTGYDLSEALVARARSKYPNVSFEVRDVLKGGISGTFDIVVSSGLNNLETGTNEVDMAALLEMAWNAAKEAVAVNMLSIYADRVDEGCYQYDPTRMVSIALHLTRYAVMRHDYMPHDFTLYLYRGPRSR